MIVRQPGHHRRPRPFHPERILPHLGTALADGRDTDRRSTARAQLGNDGSDALGSGQRASLVSAVDVPSAVAGVVWNLALAGLS